MKRFRLGINGWRLCAPHTGVARYLLNVIRHWTPDATSRFGEITLYTPTPVDRRVVPLPANIRERVIGPAWPMIVWENLRFGPAADDDVLFCPSFSRPIVARGRTVVATHDVIYHVRPELFPASVRLFYRRLYDWSDRHAALVITDGEAVKRDIVEHCGIPGEHVRVTYLAPADCFVPLADRREAEPARITFVGADVPFFLFVGRCRPPQPAAARRSLRAVQTRRACRTGSCSSASTRISSISARWPPDSASRTPSATPAIGDEDLNRLYNAAAAFVMPSVRRRRCR